MLMVLVTVTWNEVVGRYSGTSGCHRKLKIVVRVVTVVQVVVIEN